MDVLIVNSPPNAVPGGVVPNVSVGPSWPENSYSWAALLAANPTMAIVNAFPGNPLLFPTGDGGMPVGALMPGVLLVSGDSGNVVKSGKHVTAWNVNGISDSLAPVPHGSDYRTEWMTGREKTARLEQMALEGAEHPWIRRVAVDLVRGLPRDAHVARLERLHRFVRDAVPYHREPVEMLHPAAQTIAEGGDCDDHAILLCALGWTLRYPFMVEPVGHPDGPAHYTCRLGSPPADSYRGDPGRTTWRSYETTIDALPGEHVLTALGRLG